MSQHEPGQASSIPKKYRVILADPPWTKDQVGNRGAEIHYPLMSLERIKAMPVVDLAEDNALLFLWTTNGTLRDGYDVAEAWGFCVRSQLTWIKFRIGLGSYLRNATEHLLVATRGKVKLQVRNQPTWMVAPVAEHSRKPAEQFAVIERLSAGPYLELFARRRPESSRPWSIWGNEVDSDITIPGYPVPSDRHRSNK